MKILYLFILLCLTTVQFAQSGNVDFNSPENIKKFADFLFCNKDYLRAALEYERLADINKSDTIEFKIALSYSYMKDYHTAIQKFSGIIKSSVYFNEAKFEGMKVNFLINDFTGLRSYYKNSFITEVDKYQTEGKKLFNFSYLFTEYLLLNFVRGDFTFPPSVLYRIYLSSALTMFFSPLAFWIIYQLASSYHYNIRYEGLRQKHRYIE